MGVAAENTFIVHNVQGLTLVGVLIFLEEDISGLGGLVFGLLS